MGYENIPLPPKKEDADNSLKHLPKVFTNSLNSKCVHLFSV